MSRRICFFRRMLKEALMPEQSQPIEDLVRTLRPEQQEAARRLIEALASKSDNTPAPEPAVRWAGALSDLRERFTSVQLQHQAPCCSRVSCSVGCKAGTGSSFAGLAKLRAGPPACPVGHRSPSNLRRTTPGSALSASKGVECRPRSGSRSRQAPETAGVSPGSRSFLSAPHPKNAESWAAPQAP
jgi:hypothetical protein